MTRTLREVMADLERTEHTITEVNFGDKMVGLSFDSMGFAYSREQAPDFVPKVGMTAFFFGKGFGSIVRGLVIADRVIYYRTEEEQEEKNRIELEQKRLKDAEEYRRKKPEHDQRIAQLPPEFQERIQAFRDFKPDWGTEFESYELFCCEEAMRMVGALKTADAIRQFYSASYEEQKVLFPQMSEGHSGNTFGASCKFALVYLENSEQIVKMHGAICALVGCADYGCWSVRKIEVGASGEI